MVSDAFRRVLETRRSYFNARFAEKRMARPNLDGDAFLQILRELVAPVIEAVAQANADAAPVCGQHLYDIALDLFADGVLTSQDVTTKTWRELLPNAARLLAQQPQRIATSTLNAAYNLSQTPDARPSQWIEIMRALAPQCADAEIFLRAGQVAAWRAGMAQYRLGALQILKTLDAEIVKMLFGLANPPDVDALHFALMANPWHVPADVERRTTNDKQIQIVKRMGAFRGFGGTFLAPPRVTWTREGFVASDGSESYLLMADAFGATLHRVENLREEKFSAPFKLQRDGRVTFEKYAATFPELANASGFAANQNTLAVTTELTHAIYFVALIQ